ncbi:MAG: hypothetical protein KGI58_00175 [Patescibacteria group bacterium]|nr:hypothetical protein [Patescibacteria group bacterium]
MNKYLPSRQFIIRVIVIAIIISVAFGIYKLVIYFKNKTSQKTSLKVLVKDLVQKDTNNNGIPDWEESLWGLDPTTNGPANKEFILAKRAALAKDTTVPKLSDGITPSKENEALSQEFFAVIMSLQQTGNLDSASMQSVADAISKKVVATPIPDIYTKDMAVIEDDGTLPMIEYYTAYLNLNNKYYKDDGIGTELSLIAVALRDKDQGALDQVGKIGEAYKAMGKDLMKIPVPTTFLANHLDLANNYEKIGESIDDMTKMLSDPMVGMRAFINYNKYSDALANDISFLSDNYK